MCRIGPFSLERPNSELTYTAFLLGLKLFGLIFIVTAIVYEVEDYTKDAFTAKLQWHSALYFTVVALTTVVSTLLHYVLPRDAATIVLASSADIHQ